MRIGKLDKKRKKSDYFEVFNVDGHCIGGFRLNFQPKRKTIELCDLMVYPAYRGKGYGTKIVNDLINTLFDSCTDKTVKGTYENFFCMIDADNPDLHHFFAKFGPVHDNCMDVTGRYAVILKEQVHDIPVTLGDETYLKGKEQGTIHVVDEYFDKFKVGDKVKVPWGDVYKVYDRMDHDPWSPKSVYARSIPLEVQASMCLASKVAALKVAKAE